MSETQLRLGWREAVWIIGMLLAIGAAYTDLRMTLVRVETQNAALLQRVDRMERSMDQR